MIIPLTNGINHVNSHYNMDSIYCFRRGESHKATDKPCQDCAFAEHSPSLSMAIVCDGHGGEKYFRSDIGAKSAVTIIKKSIHSFVENMNISSFNNDGNLSVFSNSHFCSYSKAESTEEQTEKKAHKALTWLFSSIISQWNDAIAKDARQRDITDWEEKHVDKTILDEFRKKRENPEATFEKNYGCTLMVYVQTPDYWFAFQLGDGKLVTMEKNNDVISFYQPVPWDDKCFLNKTTSLCDSHALDEFRYCYQGDGTFPVAAFLGSDGMDDSYGDGENLYNFYANLYKQIAKSGVDVASNMLNSWLPEISKIGSKDDMSVACIFDDHEINLNFYAIIEYQKSVIESQILEHNEKIEALHKKIDDYDEESKLSRSEKINLDYDRNDLNKIISSVKQARKKLRDLQDEIIRFDNGRKKQHHSHSKSKSVSKQKNLASKIKRIRK